MLVEFPVATYFRTVERTALPSAVRNVSVTRKAANTRRQNGATREVHGHCGWPLVSLVRVQWSRRCGAWAPGSGPRN